MVMTLVIIDKLGGDEIGDQHDDDIDDFRQYGGVEVTERLMIRIVVVVM